MPGATTGIVTCWYQLAVVNVTSGAHCVTPAVLVPAQAQQIVAVLLGFAIALASHNPRYAFIAGLAIRDPHRRRRGTAVPAALRAEPVQRPVRHRDALPLQQHPDLHHRQVLPDPGLDLVPAGLQRLPRRP